MDRDENRQSSCHETGVRTLFIVDIENVVGASKPLTPDQVGRAQARIHAAVTPRTGDHSVIASNRTNAAAVCFAWSGTACRKIRSGKDGADEALLEELSDPRWVAARYGHVVIASGDHAFADAVAAIKSLGCPVTVIAPDVGLSKRMRLAAGPDLVQLGSPIPANVITLFRNAKELA